ncbi:MAG: TIM-barrel domain-containing protein [Planctomycetota bacterium]
MPHIRYAAIAMATTLTATAAHAQWVGEAIGDRIVRFYPTAAVQTNGYASIALRQDFPATGPVPANWTIFPQDVITGFTHAFDFAEDIDFYGAGMVEGAFRRNGDFITFENFDNFNWGPGTDRLYTSTPFVLGVRPDGSAFGIINDVHQIHQLDMTGTEDPAAPDLVFSGQPDGRAFSSIVIERENPLEVVQVLGELTGTMPMPPKWSLGYQQARFNPSYTQATATTLANEFRNRSIPSDVIYFDINYMVGFRNFTIDPGQIQDVTALDGLLESLNFQTVWNINAPIKVDPNYSVYTDGLAADVFVKRADTSLYIDQVFFSGASVWFDFLNAAARAFYGNLVQQFARDSGIDGVWNDLNEPALQSASRTMPFDNLHDADPDLGGPGDHFEYHNVFGMQHARATYDALMTEFPDRRPWILCRANFLGGQRYAASWTGDNRSDQYAFDQSIPMILNQGISGQPFSGPDIGGFVNGVNPTLYRRWIAVGAFYPFSRSHTGDPQLKDPISFGSEIEETARRALNRRYRLMDHLYTAAWRAHTDGTPIARPLFFEDPSDPALRDVSDAFLFGPGIVVSLNEGVEPVCGDFQPGSARPSGPRFRFAFPVSDSPGAPMDNDDPFLPTLTLLGGNIVPAGDIIQHTGDNGIASQLTLIVALDENGNATGELYEDDGDGFDFQTGDFLHSVYTASTTGNQVTISLASEDGMRARPSRTLNVRLLIDDFTEITATGVDGMDVVIDLPAPLNEIRGFDPVDGCAIPDSFTSAVAVQTNPTNFGNNQNELNQLFAEIQGDALRVGIPGNIEQNGNGIILFIDAAPGGQNELDITFNPPPSGLRELDGTLFDTGFQPERALFVNAFGGSIFADWLNLPTNDSATKTFRGQGAVNSLSGALGGGTNPNGLQVALTDVNVAGVTDSSAADAASARAGFEALIPLADLNITPDECADVKVLVWIIAPNGTISNQWLPPLPASVGGNTFFAPDTTFISGEQFTNIACGASVPGDVDGDGQTTTADITLVVSNLGAGSPGATGTPGDADGDGVTTTADITFVVSNLGAGVPAAQ